MIWSARAYFQLRILAVQGLGQELLFFVWAVNGLGFGAFGVGLRRLNIRALVILGFREGQHPTPPELDSKRSLHYIVL